MFSQSHQHHIKDEGKLNISDLECHYSIAMKNGLSKEQITDISNSDAFINMINAISSYSTETSKELRTTTLWLLYIEYIYIVKEFLAAEKTLVFTSTTLVFHWYLLLQALVKMTNLFAAASGH